MGGAIFYGDQESVHPQRCPSSKDQVHGEPTLLLLTFPRSHTGLPFQN